MANTLELLCDILKLPQNIREMPCPIELPDMDRDDMAELFGKLGLKKGAEVGVERGVYSEQICKRNPGVELHLVDAWQVYPTYREHLTQSKLDGFVEYTKEKLKGYNVKFHKGFSMEVVKKFAPKSLDFVYIDANHTLPFVIEDLYHWEKVVRHGGVVSGHDYCLRNPGPYQVHVVQAVQAFTSSYFIRPWFVVGRKDVRPGEKRDRPRSFFWVKD